MKARCSGELTRLRSGTKCKEIMATASCTGELTHLLSEPAGVVDGRLAEFLGLIVERLRQ